uniref:Uncharacterized protein n=1 Tax=Marseillevirus LCMAC202 TaxID=2506606 RepID=A0A481YZL2_9VIRU|nr:MAG: hypothetical protein LCMAC202_02570 [Marseillevirus LCMAC202]
MAVSLKCCSWDYFEYNYQGPTKSRRAGERMFLEVIIDETGIKTFSSDCDFREYLICSPAGRVIKSGKYVSGKEIKWRAEIVGVYLFKLWIDDSTPDYFTAKFGKVESAKVKVWSKVMSNKDGTLYQANTDKDLRNDVSVCAMNTRADRHTASAR